ncbi:hypothetical protein COLO4_08507 [Corchorus olitorius]|uniref:Uncharacterized protein n=1 Tax=Corchorus olitorius TaxID=93759 RepID=A0A1R3KFM0_9ROSI|nr:hypothetical protein COLO4_08507 [Corchorus olitorius]
MVVCNLCSLNPVGGMRDFSKRECVVFGCEVRGAGLWELIEKMRVRIREPEGSLLCGSEK